MALPSHLFHFPNSPYPPDIPGNISPAPAVSFQEILDGEEVKAGSHVKGDIVYVLDYFATESTYTQRSDGSRSGDDYETDTQSMYFVLYDNPTRLCILSIFRIITSSRLKTLYYCPLCALKKYT